MLDIGWSELVVIGVVALIVIGPKDLPRMFHALGKVTAKLRSMAREFQTAMNDAAKSSGLDDVRRDLDDLKKVTSPRALGIDALESAASKFEKWDPKSVTRPKGAEAAAAVAATAGPETRALAEKVAEARAETRDQALKLQAERTAAASAELRAKAQAAAAEGTAGGEPDGTAPAQAGAAAPPAPEAASRKPATRRRKTESASAPPSVAAPAAVPTPSGPRRRAAATGDRAEDAAAAGTPRRAPVRRRKAQVQPGEGSEA